MRGIATPPAAPPSRRLVDRVRLKTGLTTHMSAVEPLIRARRAVLGERAAQAPRVLIRVDEFPLAGSFDGSQASCARFAEFEALMVATQTPYLLAVTPRVARDVLDPRVSEDRAMSTEELEVLTSLPRDRVEFALHGYDHRTRRADPRRRSEFDGLNPAQLIQRLEHARGLLAPLGIEPRVFVPPFNHFEACQYDVLAEHFDVVCAGPETVKVLGLRHGPIWFGDAVFLPSYPPLYGRAAEARKGMRKFVDARAGLWIAIVVHWSWEADDQWTDLRALLDEISPYVAPWCEFLDEVRGSR